MVSMGLLDIIRLAFRGQRQISIPLVSGSWAIPPERTTEAYLKAYGTIGWLFAVVSKISIGVSEIQWHLYDDPDPNKRKEIFEHPLINLLKQPNPFMTGSEYMELLNSYMELTGECFSIKIFNRLKAPAQLWPKAPQHFEVVPDPYEYIKGYVYKVGGEGIPLETDEVLHLKTPNPYNPYRGLGMVQALAIDLDTEDFAARWNRNFFYNEGRPDGILRLPGIMKDEDYKTFKEDWSSKHIGLANAHKTAVIRGDNIDYKQISLSQKDMDWLSLRKLTRDNILGIAGMPASMMGIGEIGSRARAEADEYIFGRWILKPRFNRYKDLYNAELCPMFDQGIFLDFEDPVPANREALVTEAVETWKAGLVKRNEGRAILGYEPEEDEELGNEYYSAPSPFSGGTGEEELQLTVRGGEGSGNWGHQGRPGEVGGSGDGGQSTDPSTRRERARQSYKPASKRVQDVADRREKNLSQVIGGKRTTDNEAYDVIKGNHAVEVKTIVDGKNTKITMHKDSLNRKREYAEKNNLTPHTVVFHEPTNSIYYKKGIGSFRLNSMAKVDADELARKFEL